MEDGAGVKTGVQDLIPDMKLNGIFINEMILGGWGIRVKRGLQDLIPDMRITQNPHRGERGGAQIEVQDLIPDMTLKNIFINRMNLGGRGRRSNKRYKT